MKTVLKYIELSPTKKQIHDSGMAFVLIILLLCVSYFRNLFEISVPINRLIILAIVIQIINMTIDKFFYPWAVIWFSVTNLLGAFVSKFFLGIIFFLVITPIGVLRKLLKKDGMKLLKYKGESKSAFITRNHTYTEKDLINPF